jgi:hypothetical protein
LDEDFALHALLVLRWEKFHHEALASRRAGERGYAKKLRDEQVRIEIENDPSLRSPLSSWRGLWIT